jgi:hypothetical protein
VIIILFDGTGAIKIPKGRVCNGVSIPVAEAACEGKGTAK